MTSNASNRVEEEEGACRKQLITLIKSSDVIYMHISVPSEVTLNQYWWMNDIQMTKTNVTKYPLLLLDSSEK
jgi:hypothetical protein